MLELFRREGVTNLVCVVTRYFGGVLLGTGGLLRAYTQSAKDALTAAGRAAVRAWREIELSCPYALLERVRQETAAFGGAVEDEDYGAEVTLRLLLPAERAGDYAARLYDLSAGKLAARPGAEVFRAAKTGG